MNGFETAEERKALTEAARRSTRERNFIAKAGCS